MSKSDASKKKPPARAEERREPGGGAAAGLEQEDVAREPAPPESESEPDDVLPRAIVMAPGLSTEDLEAIARDLVKHWTPRVRSKVLCRAGVDPRSVEEIVDTVLVVVCAEQATPRGVEHVGAFVDKVIDNIFCNRHRKGRVPLDRAADVARAPDSAPSPESALRQTQRAAQLEGYFRHMRPAMARVIRARDLEGLTYDALGEELGCSAMTARRVYHKARKQLEGIAHAAERRRQAKK